MPDESTELEKQVQELFGLLGLETEEKRNEFRDFEQESDVDSGMHCFIDVSSRAELYKNKEEKEEEDA